MLTIEYIVLFDEYFYEKIKVDLEKTIYFIKNFDSKKEDQKYILNNIRGILESI